MLSLPVLREDRFLYFLYVGESNEFQILFQHRGAQRPKVSRVVVLHVHEIRDVRILRMIIDLGLQREVTARLEILEGLPEREQRVGQVIQRSEMKHHIECPGAGKRFGIAQLKITRWARQRSEKTRDLDMPPVGVHASGRKLIFQRGADRVVTGIATNIQQTAAREFRERDRRRRVCDF